MDAAFYWIGVFHVAIYAIAGSAVVLFYVVFWAHWKAKLIVPILTWYAAKRRWDECHKHGLTDAEWERGEPKP